MAPYADFPYYLGVYRGKMPEVDYGRLARRASAYLDTVTFHRIRYGYAEDERVKDACCAIADIYYLEEHGGGVASETNDGISVTYMAGVGRIHRTLEQEIWEIAMTYLAPTGLLYQGVF